MRDQKPMLLPDANLRSLKRAGGEAFRVAHSAFWSWWDGIEADRTERLLRERHAKAERLLGSRTPIELWACRGASAPTVPPPCMADLGLGDRCPALNCTGKMVMPEPCRCSSSPRPPCVPCESGELVCDECDLTINTYA